MAPETENLVLEQLRYMRGKLDKLDTDMMDVKQRLTSLDGRIAQLHTMFGSLHGDFAGQSARIDRIEMRLDRIERRLDLAPA